jgi:hypothetical protein
MTLNTTQRLLNELEVASSCSISVLTLRKLRIPMMSISHSDLMPIRAERSDAGLSQCETVIDIRQ